MRQKYQDYTPSSSACPWETSSLPEWYSSQNPGCFIAQKGLRHPTLLFYRISSQIFLLLWKWLPEIPCSPSIKHLSTRSALSLTLGLSTSASNLPCWGYTGGCQPSNLHQASIWGGGSGLSFWKLWFWDELKARTRPEILGWFWVHAHNLKDNVKIG